MAKNTRNTDNKPLGTTEQPFGGNSDTYERNTTDRDFSPADEGREERNGDPEPIVPEGEVDKPQDFGTSVKVSLIGYPDTWLIKSESGDVSFQGDVETFLQRSGVTDVTYDDRPST